MPLSTWLAYTSNPPQIIFEGGGNRSQFRSQVRRELGVRDFEICARVTAAKEMPEALAVWDGVTPAPPEETPTESSARHRCLDCGQGSITAVCGPCTNKRQDRDPQGWFEKIRADLWAAFPNRDWDMAGLGKHREKGLVA